MGRYHLCRADTKNGVLGDSRDLQPLPQWYNDINVSESSKSRHRSRACYDRGCLASFRFQCLSLKRHWLTVYCPAIHWPVSRLMGHCSKSGKPSADGTHQVQSCTGNFFWTLKHDELLFQSMYSQPSYNVIQKHSLKHFRSGRDG